MYVAPKEHDVILSAPREIAQDIFESKLSCDLSKDMLKPGQFLNLKVPGDNSELLRIPLSYAHMEDNEVTIIYQVIGSGTRRLSELPAGTKTNMLAPLGHGFDIPQDAKRALLVGGGVGIVPLIPLAEALKEANIAFDVALGFANADKIYGMDELKALSEDKVHISTDDGSAGYKGFVTKLSQDLIDNNSYDVLYTCGPHIMMKAVAQQGMAAEIPTQASLERGMICGFGACSSCVVKLTNGTYVSACKFGPVFDASEVDWDE
ncbi:MAG: dihydroorotate dehydrogenase electron transfer subunit [Coriobacteriia bacterium]|nr:dihydroorotate dehydrogenase electron transfer subunit [Coriobacteriia bacterium]